MASPSRKDLRLMSEPQKERVGRAPRTGPNIGCVCGITKLRKWVNPGSRADRRSGRCPGPPGLVRFGGDPSFRLHQLAVTAMDVKLVWERGGKRKQVFLLRSDEMVIGRQSGGGLRIPAPEVSRVHCRICRE